ncbi:hypothetical protein HDU93_005845 [Gonapodya sp. JEL0774]|nr:hypothetical protein HDU93_005845 [Gonapodya sp. JEL0774]
MPLKFKPANSYDGFLQEPPHLGNQYDDDSILKSILGLHLSPEHLATVESDLRRFGDEVVSGKMLEWVRDAEENPPRLKQFDAWGRRIDQLITSEGWRNMRTVAAKEGIISAAYDQRSNLSFNARLVQFAKYYIYSPSSALFTCPLAMTDGCARLVELSGDRDMYERVFKRLTSRDPEMFWTSGQWMSERPGGSDVANTESIAVPCDDGSGLWEIYGFKFFSSGTDSDAAFLLARHGTRTTSGDIDLPPGSKGLSLFQVDLRLPSGGLNGVRIQRLKDKLGTVPVPTAELELVGMKARLVGEPYKGVKTIATVLNVTRVHCAVSSCSFLRRALALARDYAHRRTAFGRTIANHPLHARLLATAELYLRVCNQLTFFVVHLLGVTEVLERVGAGALPPSTPLPPHASSAPSLLRLLTPCLKLFTSSTCVDQISACMEAMGGQGYMEDAGGIPRLWRDAQVQRIWEGTGAIMAGDVRRVLGGDGGQEVWEVYEEHVHRFLLPSLASDHPLHSSRTVVLRSLSLLTRHVMAVRRTGETPQSASKAVREIVDRMVERTMVDMAWSVAEVMASAVMVHHASHLISTSPGSVETLRHIVAISRWCSDTGTYPGYREVGSVKVVDAVLKGEAYQESGWWKSENIGDEGGPKLSEM